MKNAFTLNEMENMFEIGGIMMSLVKDNKIEIEDSKDAFYYALTLAIDFEKEYANTEDYYNDIDEFVVDKILEEFGTESK
jgi:DNA mismatch repair ATPase MutS